METCSSGNGEPAVAQRRRRIGVLARASTAELVEAWYRTEPKPSYRFVRPPETGLVMVQGRQGGTGGRFNFGEMTVTRCAVEVEDGSTGYGYVAGRDARRAELVAVFDALFQDEAFAPDLERRVIAPLTKAHAARRRDADTRTAATRVDFFTLVRGEDE